MILVLLIIYLILEQEPYQRKIWNYYRDINLIENIVYEVWMKKMIENLYDGIA